MTEADLKSRATKVENVKQLLLQQVDQITHNMAAGGQYATGHLQQFLPQHFSDQHYGHYATQYPQTVPYQHVHL